MDYDLPDEAEKWLRENDPDFGQGEKPYLSQWQADFRNRKEASTKPVMLDGLDYTGSRCGNYGTRGQARAFQKDRHKRGQKDTELW